MGKLTMTIQEAISDKNICYDDLHDTLWYDGIGNWDNVSSAEALQAYIYDMMKQEVKVSHILKVMEEDFSEYEDWRFNKDCSLNIPRPINSKRDLVEALYIWNDEELNRSITIHSKNIF